MTDTKCEPPTELRGVDGWHWISEHSPVCWIADQQGWDWGEDDYVTPDAAYRYGYRYLAPVATPATVRALVESLEALNVAIPAVLDAADIDAAVTVFMVRAVSPTGSRELAQRSLADMLDASRAALARSKAEGLA